MKAPGPSSNETLTTLRVTCARESADAISDALVEAGALAVTMSDAGVGVDERPVYEPGVGETPLWPRTAIEALFADDDAAALAWRMVDPEARHAAGAMETGTLAPRNWTRAWLDRFRPQRFGRQLWICPRESEAPPAALAPGATIVRLDPGLAFGTGNHATTALCLEWLESLEWPESPSRSQTDNTATETLIDYGCGSGILAIAAARLGAPGALGIDHDPQALTATVANAADNGVADRIRVGLPEAALGKHCEVLVANILAGPLIDLHATLCALVVPSGHVALSGILEDQADAVRKAYSPYVDFAPTRQRDDWVLLAGVRNQRAIH